MEACKGWGRLLNVSLPAYAMLATEWWTYEILTLFSGMLPNATVSVVGIDLFSDCNSPTVIL
jgi:hypothetical protein